VGQRTAAAFFVDGNTRKIADFLVQAGKRVEQGALTAIGVADEGNM
jgi:hypothetical protein